MKKLFYSFYVLAMIIFFICCASTPPEQIDNENSLIAIQIGGVVHPSLLTWEPFRPEKIFFVKLDNDNLIKSDEIIESSINIEAWWGDNLIGRNTTYLYNVKPGKYAVVAAYGIGYLQSTEVFIIFSQELIRSTIIDVKPSSFVYMGGFITDNKSYNNSSEKIDDIQKFYFDKFYSINNSDNIFINILNKKIKYFAGDLKQRLADKKEKQRFLESQLKDFKGTRWESLIKKELLTQ